MAVKTQTIEDFLTQLGSSAPTPGGGGASSLAGAYGVSLGLMVGNLTRGKKKYAEFEARLAVLMDKLTGLQSDFLQLADADEAVFAPLAEAYRLPKETAEELAHKEEVLETCLLQASMVPLQIMEKACEAVNYLEELGRCGSRLAVSDVGVGVQFLNTALTGAVMNVYINTKLMKNREKAEELNAYAARLLEDGTHKVYGIYEEIERELCGS